MHVVGAALVAGDADMAVVAVAVTDPQHIARLGFLDGKRCGGGIVQRLRLMRQGNSHLQIRPANQARAVEGLGAFGAPHVRAADAGERVVHHRPVRRDGHRRDAVGVLLANGRRRCGGLFGAVAVLLGLECLLRLLVELLEDGLHVLHFLLRLVLDALCFLSRFRRSLFLLFQLHLVVGDLVAQGAVLLDHLLVVFVERLVHVQPRGEFLPRRRAHEQIDEGELAGLVHADAALGQAILQDRDALVGAVDALLGVLDRFDGLLVLVERRVVLLRGLGQLVLQRRDALVDGIGLGEFFLGGRLVFLGLVGVLVFVGVLRILVLVSPCATEAKQRGRAENRRGRHEQTTVDKLVFGHAENTSKQRRRSPRVRRF